MTPLLAALAIAALLGASFFFRGSAASFAALQKLDRRELAARRGAGALVDRLLRGGRRPILATAAIGLVAANVAVAALTSSLASTLPWPWVGAPLAAAALVLLSEAARELGGRRYPRRWATLAVGPLSAAHLALAPVRVLLSLVVAGLARGFGSRAPDDHEGLAEEELLGLMDRGAATGAVDPAEREIIENVFEFDDLTVDRMMTPRPDIVSLPIDLPWAELVRRCREAEYSRIPLYQRRPEDIVGVLLVKDLLRHRDAPPEGPRQLRSLLLPPSFVPATKSADAMLEEFLRRRLHMTFVVDEHGTLVGLLTLDDLLNELLGDDPDDDTGDHEVHQVSPDALTVRAAIDVDDFEEETGIALPDGDWNTVGGFVFHELGRLPRAGDRVSFDRWTFVVAKMEGRRIHELEVVRDATPPGVSA